MRCQVEILFPLSEINDPSTRAWFVDGGSNQSAGPGPFSGSVAPGALPHQIATDTLRPPSNLFPYRYFEATIVNHGPEYSALVGICDDTFQLAVPATIDALTPVVTCTNGIFYSFTQTRVWGYPFNGVACPGIAIGHTVGIAVDLLNCRMWLHDIAANFWYGLSGGASPTFEGLAGIPFDNTFDPIAGNIFILGGAGHDIEAPVNQFTFSNNNLTATAVKHNATDTVIGTTTHGSGKYYFELTNVMTGGADLCWGIAATTAISTNPVGDANSGIGLERGGGSSRWRVNGGFSSSGMPDPATGDVIGIAVDFDNFLIWVRNATAAPSNWYGDGGTGDPATGVNGTSFGNHGACAIGFTSNQNGVDEGCTMNAGASAFVAAAPSGFSAWDNSGGDHWNTSFPQTAQYASLTLNAGRSAFVGALPSGFVAWDNTGATKWNSADNSGLTLSNGNLTLTGDNNPTSTPNQPTYFVRSTTSYPHS